MFLKLKQQIREKKHVLRTILGQRTDQICQLFSKLSLVLKSTKVQLNSVQEFISSEYLIESLNPETYFKTAQKVTEEISRRKEVNSNFSKLWLALQNLAKEENTRRKEFNASKYF